MPETKPPFFRTLTRMTIPVGIAALLFGFVLRNSLTGATLRAPAVLLPVLLGALLFLLGIAFNARWICQKVSTRRFLIRLNAWAMTFLGILLLIIANTIVAMTPQTESWFIDCTETGVYTLSGKTKKILQSLTKETRIIVLQGSGNVDFGIQGTVNLTERLRDLVRLYDAESRQMSVEIVNAYRDKMRTQQIEARLGETLPADTVIVEADARHHVMPYEDMASLASFEEGTGLSFLGEAKLTEAILKVTEAKPAQVYFLVGHGEFGISGPSTGALTAFVAELRRDNCHVQTLSLFSAGSVPPDCDLLVIAGPTAGFPEGQIDQLRAYLERGGKLLVLLRPKAMLGNAKGLDHLLADYNVKIQDDYQAISVYKRASTGATVPNPLILIQKDSFAAHPITEELSLGAAECLLDRACPMTTVVPEVSRGLPGPRTLDSQYKAEPLLRTPANSWGESEVAVKPWRFDEEKDLKGPLTLGMAVEYRKDRRTGAKRAAGQTPAEEARLVVLGSFMAFSDDSLRNLLGNRMLIMNCVNWLTHKEMKSSIPPDFAGRRELTASQAAKNTVFYITFLGMPLLGALCGGFVWWVRRRS